MASNPYKVLAVPTNANATEIKYSYRKLALKNHPDKVFGDETVKLEASRKFAEIAAAYGVLSDKRKKWEYDNINGIDSDRDTSTSCRNDTRPSGHQWNTNYFTGNQNIHEARRINFGNGFSFTFNVAPNNRQSSATSDGNNGGFSKTSPSFSSKEKGWKDMYQQQGGVAFLNFLQSVYGILTYTCGGCVAADPTATSSPYYPNTASSPYYPNTASSPYSARTSMAQ